MSHRTDTVETGHPREDDIYEFVELESDRLLGNLHATKISVDPETESVTDSTIPVVTALALAPHAQTKDFGNSGAHCGERIILSSDWLHSLLILVLVVIPLAGFNYIWILEIRSPHSGALVKGLMCIVPVAVASVLALITLASMFACVLKNPGVIKKQLNLPSNAPPRGHVAYIEVKGRRMILPYCAVCNIIRPPRSSHCRQCDNCVIGFDHHCGVIGACVGQGNFRYFFLFLSAATLLCMWAISWSIVFIVPTFRSASNLVNACNAVSILSGFFFGFLVGSMLCTYVKLISSGFTQREAIKREFLYGPSSRNPFDAGCCQNWSLAMNCTPMEY